MLGPHTLSHIHTDGQTYMTKLPVAFRNFVKATKITTSSDNNIKYGETLNKIHRLLTFRNLASYI